MVESHLSVHDILVSTVFFLSATCIAVPLFKKIGLGSVLGYLTAGVFVGPFGFDSRGHLGFIFNRFCNSNHERKK